MAPVLFATADGAFSGSALQALLSAQGHTLQDVDLLNHCSSSAAELPAATSASSQPYQACVILANTPASTSSSFLGAVVKQLAAGAPVTVASQQQGQVSARNMEGG